MRLRIARSITYHITTLMLTLTGSTISPAIIASSQRNSCSLTKNRGVLDFCAVYIKVCIKYDVRCNDACYNDLISIVH